MGAVRAARVPVQVGEPGFFDRAGVFFADVALTPELVGLQKQVVAANEKCGFEAEARPYHPHITLARIKKSEGIGRALKGLKERVRQPVKFSRFVAAEFVLYESVPVAGGSRYDLLERFRLN
jgi:2'-5' RNA ligase